MEGFVMKSVVLRLCCVFVLCVGRFGHESQPCKFNPQSTRGVLSLCHQVTVESYGDLRLRSNLALRRCGRKAHQYYEAANVVLSMIQHDSASIVGARCSRESHLQPGLIPDSCSKKIKLIFNEVLKDISQVGYSKDRSTTKAFFVW